MAIAAIVMVIMSKGNSAHHIIPNTTTAPSKFGRMPIIAKVIDRNNTKNMIAIPNITTPMVLICDLNKLCSILL